MVDLAQIRTDLFVLTQHHKALIICIVERTRVSALFCLSYCFYGNIRNFEDVLRIGFLLFG